MKKNKCLHGTEHIPIHRAYQIHRAYIPISTEPAEPQSLHMSAEPTYLSTELTSLLYPQNSGPTYKPYLSAI